MWQFLGIGAQKAGTTWLYQNLQRHPEISFPGGKEMHFWNRPHDAAAVGRYLSTFSGGDTACEGEITPAYAILPVAGVAEIAHHAPALRILYLLRNPVERAWSSALMALDRAEMEWGEASEAWFMDHFRSAGSLARGDYARCLQGWLEHYRRDQLLVMFYDDVLRDPAAVLGEACAHLGVSPPDAHVLNDASRRVFAGSGHALPPRLRAFLQEVYEPRIRALEALLDVRLPAWRQAEAT
ncbi:sulfotransferase domain-containing protein [Algiphilus sp.]|uniref:sulfotransferase domain-containing protein n=1 Tax=Algiphilus sp. TaxID=1872431 RepID=UPI0032EDB7A0